MLLFHAKRNWPKFSYKIDDKLREVRSKLTNSYSLMDLKWKMETAQLGMIFWIICNFTVELAFWPCDFFLEIGRGIGVLTSAVMHTDALFEVIHSHSCLKWVSEDIHEGRQLAWLYYVVREVSKVDGLSQKRWEQNLSKTMGLQSVGPESLWYTHLLE